MARSVSASFGKVTIGHPTSLTITLSNPTGTDETFTVSKTKFTPSYIRRDGPQCIRRWDPELR